MTWLNDIEQTNTIERLTRVIRELVKYIKAVDVYDDALLEYCPPKNLNAMKRECEDAWADISEDGKELLMEDWIIDLHNTTSSTCK